jgi:lipopolysaccharide transport system permease protein
MDASPTASPRTGVTVIRPSQGWLDIGLRELWQFRELLYYFTWRDLKVRYKQTALGFTWAIIGPLTQTVAFTLIFSRAAGLPTDGLPATLYNMAGLVAWRYFSTALSTASMSLVSSSQMMTKIYFPRLLMPLSACATCLADLGVGLVAVLILVDCWHVVPAWTIVYLPVFTLLMIAATLGPGLFFAALNVRFRDVSVLVPFLLQIWLYITVIFPFSKALARFGKLAYLLALNPMTGVVEGYRWCFMSTHPGSTMASPWPLLAIGSVPTVIMLAIGLFYFRRVESQFADIV